LAMLARPHLKLPPVMVLPDMHLDGRVAGLLGAFAASRGLALIVTCEVERPFLQSDLDGDAYLKASLSARHLGGFSRMRRRLEEGGTVEYRVARQPEEVRLAMEAFLSLVAAGWKGRRRTALASDRYRAASAREAVHRLAERDM